MGGQTNWGISKWKWGENGCMLSIYCMERLTHGFDNVVSINKWKFVQLNKNGLNLTHLLFTDDLIVFSKASRSQATIINDVLEHFCQSSTENQGALL